MKKMPDLCRHLELWPGPGDRHQVEACLREFARRSRGPLIAIAPGSRSGARTWPAERFILVAKELVARLGVRIAIIGGTSDEDIAYASQRHCKCTRSISQGDST